MLTRVISRLLLTIIVFGLVISPLLAQGKRRSRYDIAPEERSYMPPAGYVPDAATAIKIAVAVWEPLYGRKQIRRQRPIVATLRNGVWLVRGSLPHGAVGGVAEVDISKRDGRILRMIHSR